MKLVRRIADRTADQVLAALQGCPATQTVTLRLSTSTPRTRHPVADLLRAHAYAAHCEIFVAETRGIAVRWVDGIVTGTAQQVADFLTTVTPVLQRSHGQATLAA